MSLASAARVAFGSFANAASVGAKTVNGPLPCSVPTSPAFLSSEASVLNDPAATAVWTIVLGAVAVASCGISTESITWMTPFVASTSGVVTCAASTKTDPFATLIASDLPSAVLAEVSFATSAAVTRPGTTW